MPLARKTKLLLAALPVVLVLLAIGSQVVRVWWFRGYSMGSRTGVVRKVSVKGPPYCKYLSAEMVLPGSLPGMPAETWEFSVDDDDERNPLVQALHDAERSGARVTLAYRQDLHSLYRCTPSEYFVTGLQR
jgi:hypothetical protein